MLSLPRLVDITIVLAIIIAITGYPLLPTVMGDPSSMLSRGPFYKDASPRHSIAYMRSDND